MSNEYDFVHGIKCYDSFICNKENCRINIADDFEYLCDSNFFNDNMNKLFVFEDQNINTIFQQSKKEKLDIKENIGLGDIEVLEDMDEEDNNDSGNDITNIDDVEIDDLVDRDSEPTMIHENESDSSDIENDDEEDDDEDDEYEDDESSNSEVVNTDDESDLSSIDIEEETDGDEEEDEEDEEGEEDEEDEDDDDDDDDSVEDLYLIIKNMPTQVIALEKCDNTLDHLLENDLLRLEELESAMFQVIVILMTYQHLFKFTHNDLHTNNIMYNETDVEFLIYKIDHRYYKIPTFGRIYKIIDFGRAIYSVNDKLLCSDSFSSNGTAHTQYNFGPYVNTDKQIIEPNYSFDLCRLACSLFDFICDDINNINDYRKEVPIYDLIFSWLYDDNNRNMLYKSNGDDKYPDLSYTK